MKMMTGTAPAARMMLKLSIPAGVQKNTDSDDRRHEQITFQLDALKAFADLAHEAESTEIVSGLQTFIDIAQKNLLDLYGDLSDLMREVDE